jgi:hypothetical protein
MCGCIYKHSYFLLQCKKKASGIIHCDYYCCWYMLCNTDGKYTKQVLDYGADVSISNFIYGLRVHLGPLCGF